MCCSISVFIFLPSTNSGVLSGLCVWILAYLEYPHYLPTKREQSVGHLTRKSGVLGPIPGLPHTVVSPSSDSTGAVVSYWRKYVHEVLVNRLGGLSLPGKSVVRVNDRPDMASDVYRGHKTTIQYNTTKRRCFEVVQFSSAFVYIA